MFAKMNISILSKSEQVMFNVIEEINRFGNSNNMHFKVLKQYSGNANKTKFTFYMKI